MSFTNKNKYNPETDGKLSDLLTLGGWKQGILNRMDEKSMPIDALVDALNVNIDNLGNIVRRDGYSIIVEGNCHSLFKFGKHIYFVKDRNLCRMDSNEVIENLITNFTDEKVYYVEVAGELYFCTKTNNRTHKINKLGKVDRWGIASPYEECEVEIGEPGSGALKKGIYRLNYSYVSNGYETAVYPKDTVFEVLYDDFNITASCNPSSQSTTANFYLSSTNGKELYFVASGYEVQIDYFYKSGQLAKQYMDAFIPLENLCFANGRIWGTKGANIFFSGDRDYRQYNPGQYLSVDGSNIVIFKAVDDGLYIVTELATYFRNVKNPEDTSDTQLTKIFDFSAIKGTLFETDDRKVGWLSHEGYIVGDSSGKLENITQDKLDFSKNYTDGSSVVMKKNGIYQVLFALKQEGEKTSFQTTEKNNEV